MKKNILRFVGFIVMLTFVSCKSDDDTSSTELRDYQEQYNTEKALIEDFMNKYYVTYDANYTTEFHLIPNGGTQTPIKNMTELNSFQVTQNDVEYTIYYLKLREGQELQRKPSRVDSVYVNYKGIYPYYEQEKNADGVVIATHLKHKTFDEIANPIWLPLDGTIRGWGEVIPKFAPAVIQNDTYQDNYGAVVMFIPSGLAYYSVGRGLLPAYSPTIFTVKLYNTKFRDHDRDGILSREEFILTDDVALDSDGDKIPDYADADDDNDGHSTKDEITKYFANNDKKYNTDGTIMRFTSLSQIPSNTCNATGTKKRHLDSSCFPPYNKEDQ